METKKWEAMLTAVEQGSFTRSARQLGLTQSGLTHMMNSLEKEVDAVLPRQVVVDCSGVTFMDSSGIAVVLRAKRRMEALAGALVVVNIPRQAARVLETAGLDRYVDLI